MFDVLLRQASNYLRHAPISNSIFSKKPAEEILRIVFDTMMSGSTDPNSSIHPTILPISELIGMDTH